METRGEKERCSLWVNWELRVISFSLDAGFEELCFRTREEKFRFAIEKGYEGFGFR